MEHGTFLGSNIHHTPNSVQQLISSYYNNPLMINLLNTPNESHYYCKINSKLLNENRYIIAITSNDNNPINTKKYLKNLNWSSFQSRSISRNYQINGISYNSDILDKIYLKSTQKNDKYTTYSCIDYPDMSIHVLNKEGHLYPTHATLCNALEEFRTLLTIKN
jgi:hypothetical protein